MITTEQVIEALNRLLADQWPRRTVYVNACPFDSARPHIRDLQAYYVGTGKGYVAVRPKAKTNVGRYAAGYITNALEGGHVSHTRAGLGYVSGKHMYADSASRAEALARRAAEEIEAAAEAALEGRT